MPRLFQRPNLTKINEKEIGSLFRLCFEMENSECALRLLDLDKAQNISTETIISIVFNGLEDGILLAVVEKILDLKEAKKISNLDLLMILVYSLYMKDMEYLKKVQY